MLNMQGVFNMKRIVLFLTCATGLMAAASQDNCAKPMNQTKKPPAPQMTSSMSGEPLYGPQPPATILKNARMETGDSWDCRFSVAFNEYYVTQEGNAVASLASVEGLLDNGYYDSLGSIVDFDYQYHAGFQAGLSVNTPYDKWMIGANYLWLRAHSNVSSTPPAGYAYASSYFAYGMQVVSSVSGTWNLGMDLLDLYLNRPFYAGTKWTVEPVFGLRGGWIRQAMHLATGPTTYDNVSSGVYQRAIFRSNSWLIGPRGGLQSNWLLGCGFSLFGDLSASLLYTRYPTLSTRSTGGGGVLILGTHDGYSALTPNLDTGMGLRWGSYFSGQRYYFDFSAAYNFSAYFSQNQLMSLNAVLQNTPGFSPGNLYMHGVSVETSFLF